MLQEDSELADVVRSAMTIEERAAWNHLYHAHGAIIADDFPRTVEELPTEPRAYSLLAVARSAINPFQHEYAALFFTLALLDRLPNAVATAFPARIKVRCDNWARFAAIVFRSIKAR